MQVKATLHCVSGSARVYIGSRKDYTTLSAGESVDAVIVDAPSLPDSPSPEQWKEFAAGIGKHAMEAAGIGGDGSASGVVSITAVSHDLIVREYLDTNAFIEPDADDYTDHTVKAGETIATDAISSNVQTLMVQSTALKVSHS